MNLSFTARIYNSATQCSWHLQVTKNLLLLDFILLLNMLHMWACTITELYRFPDWFCWGVKNHIHETGLSLSRYLTYIYIMIIQLLIVSLTTRNTQYLRCAVAKCCLSRDIDLPIFPLLSEYLQRLLCLAQYIHVCCTVYTYKHTCTCTYMHMHVSLDISAINILVSSVVFRCLALSVFVFPSWNFWRLHT